MQLAVLGVSVVITAFIQFSGFLVAFWLQTEKFYDILGGLNFISLAAYSALSAQSGLHPWSEDPRKIAITSVFVCSRGWLLLFLAWRAHERQGDSRFDGVTDKFWKFLIFWTAQGMWVLIISLPMLFVNSSAVWQPDSTTFDRLTFSGFAGGVLLELVADTQKAIWVRAGRKGCFCQSGVWSLSRHPNYFGEMLQWWCAWSFAFSSGSGLTDVMWGLGILSPLCTSQILLNIPETGVMQANGKSLKRYYDKVPEEYAKYRQSTSILLPMIGYKYVPVFFKRTVFLDLARYEYRPRKEDAVHADSKSD